jgi:hypothetical protein
MSYLGANIRKKKQVGPFAAKKVKAVLNPKDSKLLLLLIFW